MLQTLKSVSGVMTRLLLNLDSDKMEHLR